MELTDGAVLLRTPVVGDAEEVVERVHSALDHLTPFLGMWASADYDVEGARAWIRNELDPTAHPFVICEPSGAIVGSAGLNRFDDENARANLGYWLHPDATGRGYATRATDLLIDYGHDELGLKRIEIIMSIDNEPSRRVAERSKADYEGVARARLKLHGRFHDCHIFAAVAS